MNTMAPAIVLSPNKDTGNDCLLPVEVAFKIDVIQRLVGNIRYLVCIQSQNVEYLVEDTTVLVILIATNMTPVDRPQTPCSL
jgi:hypothetical protein